LIAARTDLGEALFATGCRSSAMATSSARSPSAAADGARAGLAARGRPRFDLAWTAAGRYDAYWEHDVKPWDIAAGLVILPRPAAVASDAEVAEDVPDRVGRRRHATMQRALSRCSPTRGRTGQR
jgi:myo-inositol-1(or 4)-monophosphatase